MSTEPERDIEKTLRDYARHRQDTGGTPPALHPANRRLLHDEVARQNSRARRTMGLGLFWSSWPGFILKGSVALVVLVVGVLVLTPLWRGQPRAKQAMTLAKNEERPVRRLADEKKDASAAQKPANDKFSPATPPSGGVASRKMDQSNLASTQSLRDAVAASNSATQRARANPTVMQPATAAAPSLALKTVPTPTPATAASAANAVSATIAAPPRPATLAANAPAPITALDAATSLAYRTTADASGLAGLGPINQQFTRVNPPARGGRGGGGGGRGGPATLRSQVLQSFRVEQNGGQIRVIDSDGSIYTGVVTLAGNLAAQSAGPVATFASAAPASTNAPAIAAAGALPVPSKPVEAGSIASLQSSNSQIANGSGARSIAPRQPSNAPAATTYSFRVSGTNLTLNQPVEFSGNFVTNDQPASAQFAAGAAVGGAGGRRAGAGGAGGGGGGGGFGGGGAPVTADTNLPTPTNLSNQSAGNPGQPTAGALVPVPSFNFRLQGQAVIGTNRLGVTAVPRP